MLDFRKYFLLTRACTIDGGPDVYYRLVPKFVCVFKMKKKTIFPIILKISKKFMEVPFIEAIGRNLCSIKIKIYTY